MALPHATSGQIVDVRPLGGKLKQSITTTLVKTDKLEGVVGFGVQGQTKVLEAGQLLYLSGSELHALKGIEDASVLVTILLEKEA